MEIYTAITIASRIPAGLLDAKQEEAVLKLRDFAKGEMEKQDPLRAAEEKQKFVDNMRKLYPRTGGPDR